MRTLPVVEITMYAVQRSAKSNETVNQQDGNALRTFDGRRCVQQL